MSNDEAAVFTVQQVIDNIPINRIEQGWYDIPGLEVDRPPQFSLDVMNPGGVEMYKLAPGKEVNIYRNGRLEMPGIVETPTGIEGGETTKVTAAGIHKGYHLLRAFQCTSYDYDEDGSPRTTRDAVTVNPWETFILRKADGTLDVFGQTLALDGITFDQYVEHILGTKFAMQHQFEDNTYLLPSQTAAVGSATARLSVFRDGPSGDKTPALQRTRATGGGFMAGASVDSIPLHNGDRNVRQMGQLNTASVLLIGNRVSTFTNPVLGTSLAPMTNDLQDASGHGVFLNAYNSPATRAGSNAKYASGYNLDGINDAFGSLDATMKVVGDVSYFFAGIIDTLPSGSNKFVLGGWFSNADTTHIPWSLYVNNAGHVIYEHKNGAITVTWDTGATVSAGSDFRVHVKRIAATGALQVRVNNGTILNTSYDPATQAPGAPAAGQFLIGTNNDGLAGFFGDGGVFEARFWARAVDTTTTLQKIADTASQDYWALLEGSEAAAWFMFGETNPGGTTTFTGADPTLSLCRDATLAAGSRTYTAVTLTRTSNYLGSGLEAWTGSIAFSGSESVKNALGFRVTLSGSNGDIGSTKVYYIKVIAGTTPVNGVTAGTIDAYVNPITINGEENWIATNVEGMSGLEALEKVRKLTEADALVNPSMHWDIWIDELLRLHFRQRRGSTVNHTYSFANENLRKISHEFYGAEIAFQTIAYGAGSGIAQTRIVSKQEYSAGGLYDSNRDPSGGTRLYGALPRILSFVDSNEVSPVALLRKARAFHRLHRDPQENVRVEVGNEAIPYFTVGDQATFKNVKTRTNASLRVINLRRRFAGNAQERAEVEVGQQFNNSVADRGADNEQKQKIISLRAQPAQATTGVSGDGVHCDATHYGVFPFAIQDGSIIDRVFLQITQVPWQVNARGGLSETHTHAATDISVGLQGVSSGNLGMPPTSIALAQSLTVTGSTSAWTDFGSAFTPAVSANAELDYIEVLSMCYNDYEALQKLNANFRVVRTNGAHNGDIIALSTVLQSFSFTSPGSGLFGDQNTVGLIHRVTLVAQNVTLTILPTDTFKLQIQTTGQAGTPFTDDFYSFATMFYQHAHNVVIGQSGAHIHKMEHGIYQFDGDTGGGDGSPLLGTGIKYAIDPPTLSNVGLPRNYDNERVPGKFGDSQVPQTILVDVTGYISTEANGVIKNGEHKVYFLAEAGTNNAKGLAVIMVTVIFKFRELKE